MVHLPSILSVPVVWRDKKLVSELNSEATLKDLGEELQQLTGVKADTMKLIIPQISTRSSKLFLPFSAQHSCLKLENIEIMQGKPLRMMGVSEHEVHQLLKDAKQNLRIAGFEEEERRMKQRISRGPQLPLKLPEGPYTFGGFRTLELPGVKLKPPASEALKRMHMLASDPGIVAIMYKHRWRVGIMTEMAPEGYVGVSPVCVLGLNKNQGEEISLRLRTDDLKGFRKYESIKKTLLHELAHMVYSEHDANFYALDKQLNQEAFALDWTRSRSHTLSDVRSSGLDDLDEDLDIEDSLPHKLGGETSFIASSAREAATAAAYHRWGDSFTIHQVSAQRQDSDDVTIETHGDSKQQGAMEEEGSVIGNKHTDFSFNQEMCEPDPDDSETQKNMNVKPFSEVFKKVVQIEPRHVDSEMMELVVPVSVGSQSMQIDKSTKSMNVSDEPDPDDVDTVQSGLHIENTTTMMGVSEEPDPDDSENRCNGGMIKPSNEINSRDLLQSGTLKLEPDPDDSGVTRIREPQSNLEDRLEHLPQIPRHVTVEPDPDDQEIKRIQDPVIVFSNKFTEAVKRLQNDLQPTDANVVLQTLLKIIRNIIENPSEMKYKKLRKANPVFQRSIAYNKAAMEVLSLSGFQEDIITDESGKTETYLVLKRNDPALLWLAKSIVETYLNYC